MGAGQSKGHARALLRHPMLTGVLVWALAHLLVNGDEASLILFGWMAVWALGQHGADQLQRAGMGASGAGAVERRPAARADRRSDLSRSSPRSTPGSATGRSRNEQDPPGHFFEDFRVGQALKHAMPRTMSEGDGALYTALYRTRFALASSDEFARACGLPRAHRRPPRVPPGVRQDRARRLAQRRGEPRLCQGPVRRAGVSGRHGDPISEVIGLRENSNGKSGVV